MSIRDYDELYGTTPQEIAANREPKNAWISVDDRLPDQTDEHVLICTSTGFTELLYYNTLLGWHKFAEGPDGGYWKRHITHWMPLPEFPEHESEE